MKTGEEAGGKSKRRLEEKVQPQQACPLKGLGCPAKLSPPSNTPLAQQDCTGTLGVRTIPWPGALPDCTI